VRKVEQLASDAATECPKWVIRVDSRASADLRLSGIFRHAPHRDIATRSDDQLDLIEPLMTNETTGHS